ncbi:MAG: sensor histidine kinase [Acidimicrobiales bacterium]
MAEPAHRLRRASGAILARVGSVRARATLVSVVVVGAALAVGALALVSLLRASMQEGVETTVATQLNDVSSLLRLGQLPQTLPSGRGATFTQVVGPGGRVLATSATLLGTRPISHLRPSEDGTVITTVPTLSERRRDRGSDAEGPYLLLAETLPAPLGHAGATGPVTVYVAGSLRPVREAVATVGVALALGLPLLVTLVGALVWIIGGRALRPVESIRAEVADISGHDLHRRVPEPASTDEVARLARTMNRMLDRLEASSDAQRQFVADASHELRSPLAVLQATLEVALAHPDDSMWPAVAADAVEEARRLHRLVEDLLLLARTGDTSQPNRMEPVDLDELVLSEGRRRRNRGGPVALDLHRVSGGRVRGDRDQLARVVHNLLDNGYRHARSRVSVELSSADSTVLLVVADDGPGIAPADRARVFERFARLDEARSQDDGGTGLGLSIARGIVTAHGGTIEITDSPVGARFTVRLPSEEETSSPYLDRNLGAASRPGAGT